MNTSSCYSDCCQVLPLVSHDLLWPIGAACLSACHLLCRSHPDPVPPFYSNTGAASGGVLQISAHREHHLCGAGWSCAMQLDFIALWWEYTQQGLWTFFFFFMEIKWDLHSTLQVATKPKKGKLPGYLVAYNVNQVVWSENRFSVLCAHTSSKKANSESCLCTC